MATVPPPPPSYLSQRVTSNNFFAMQSCYIIAQPSASSITFINLPGGKPITMKIYNSNTTAGNTAYVCGSSSQASGGAITAVASTTNPTSAGMLMFYTSGNTSAHEISISDAIPAGSILTQDYVYGVDTLSVITPSGYSCKLELSLGYGT